MKKTFTALMLGMALMAVGCAHKGASADKGCKCTHCHSHEHKHDGQAEHSCKGCKDGSCSMEEHKHN